LPKSVVKLFAASYEPRLCGCHGRAGERGDFREIVPEDVEEKYRGRPLAIHRRELLTNARELAARASLALGVDTGAGAAGFDVGIARAIDHAPLTGTRSQRVETHVAGDGRGQSTECTAGPRTLVQGDDDLLEDRLHEIVMVLLASPEDANESAVDDADESVVQYGRLLRIATT
jgi:hypothetical protein